jgi:deoxyribonuclease IV
MSLTRRIGGHVSTSGGIHLALDRTVDIGGNTLQIFAGSPRMWARRQYTPQEADHFNNLADSLDIEPVFIHALYLINLASDNPELVEKSEKSLIMDLTNGRLIRSSGVIVHIGSHQGRGYDSVRSQLIEVITRILDQTSDTPLILENDAGQNGKIGSFEEISDLISQVKHPRLGFCLDTAHTFEQGIDLRQPSSVNDLVKLLSDLAILDRLALIHLNDSRTPLGSGRDIHANIGQGEIGSEGLSQIINHKEFVHLPIILEVPGTDNSGPDKANIDLVKSLIRI